MARYQHFEVAEHEERSVSRRIAAGEKYTEATGNRETVKYTGRWADMVALMESQTGGGSVEVSCDLERLGGGIGELRITRETYRIPSNNEGGEGEPGGGGGGEGNTVPGESEADPVCTVRSSLVQVCILAHPKFVGMPEWERRALKAMIDGQDENSLIEGDESGPDGAPVMKRIKDCIASEAGLKAFDFISRGVVFWNDVSVEASLRWKGRANKYAAGQIVGSIPGITAAEGRTWLCSGVGTEQTGSVTWSTASFRLSGPGGWDEFLYTAGV